MIHLLRTAAGIESIDHFKEVIARRTIDVDGVRLYPFSTRRQPVRHEELLKGGSVYWIVKRKICIRQDIMGFQMDVDGAGKSFCWVFTRPELILTETFPKKPVQGWRYLKPEDAPNDLSADYRRAANDLPPEMVKELKKLGLL